MFTLSQHRAWCKHPTGDGPAVIRDAGNCVGVARRSWGIPSLGGSANEAWGRVPHAERHHSDPLDVPEGALCYGMFNHHYGHCWVASTDLKGWTTDYVRSGTFQLAPMSLPRWTGDQKVWWTSWTQHGRLPVGMTERGRRAGHTTPAPSHSVVSVRLGNLHYGMRNDDVKDLQRALNRHLGGSDIQVTGYYGDQTDAKVRECQRNHLPPADPAGRSFVGSRQASHLGLKVV